MTLLRRLMHRLSSEVLELYELQMSQTNSILDDNIDTIFFTTSLEYAYLSSSTVREAAFYGADISRFVPESVVNQVYERLKDKGEKNE